MNYDLYNIDVLQEMYAVKFYKHYKVFPKAKHLETNKDLLIKKIKILNHLNKK